MIMITDMVQYFSKKKQNSITLYCVTALINSYMVLMMMMMMMMMMIQKNIEHDI
jgi:hypothetical protein